MASSLSSGVGGLKSTAKLAEQIRKNAVEKRIHLIGKQSRSLVASAARQIIFGSMKIVFPQIEKETYPMSALASRSKKVL
jgi:hypothetical protein